MEHISSNVINGAAAVIPIVPAATQRAPAISGPNDAQSGKDSAGGESQGRGGEQANAHRSLTFQDTLLSSTTLSNLQDALTRITYNRDGSQGRRLAAPGDKSENSDQTDSVRTSSDVADASASEDVVALSTTSSSTGKVGWGLRDLLSGAYADQSSSGDDTVDDQDGYYGPDWAASGQLLDATRRALAVYQQSLQALPGSGVASKAEVLDMVA